MARETVRIEGLSTLQRRLMAFPKEMSVRGGPVRKGVRAGAVVIQKQAQANIDRIVKTPNIGGVDYSTGVLKKGVKVVRAKAPKKYNGETAFVMIPRRAKYPVSKNQPRGQPVRLIGAMLEYGTSKRRPMPWMAPAFHSKKQEAMRVMVDELRKGIEAVERKIARSIK